MYKHIIEQLGLTARQYLGKWLQNPDLPTEPIQDQLATITKHFSGPSQHLLPTLFETDMFVMTFKAWYSRNALPEFVDAILNFVRAVTDAVLESPTHDLTCEGPKFWGTFWTEPEVGDFLYQMYEVANLSDHSPLAQQPNHVITRNIFSLFDTFEHIFLLWFPDPKNFPPIDFLVKHITDFPKETAIAFRLSRYRSHPWPIIDKHKDLAPLLVWTEDDNSLSFEKNWKFAYFEEGLYGVMLLNVFTASFAGFLALIDTWQRALDVTLYFVNILGPDSPINVQAVPEIEKRMLALLDDVQFDSHSEFQVVTILDYMGQILDCENARVIRSLFYERKYGSTRWDGWRRFEYAALSLFADQEDLLSAHEQYYRTFKETKRKKRRRKIELTREKRLLLFLLRCLENFLQNSTIINKSVTYCVAKLITYDYQHTLLVQTSLVEILVRTLESLNLEAFRSALLVSLDLNEEETAATFNWLGAKQNLEMFEKIVSFLYAEVRAKLKQA